MIFNIQLDEAQSDQEIRYLFDDENVLKGDNDNLVDETGFRKPLSQLTLQDRPNLQWVLRDHHTVLKIKPEIDQYCDGLETLGVLECVRKYPCLMRPL